MTSSQDCLPYFAEGPVVPGFGRGSKELGIPTANFPEEVVSSMPSHFECGVYFGWAKISRDDNIYRMVMSVGWNPYYHNTVKTMETHIIHNFDQDFYGEDLKIVVLGHIRPMSNFESLDALIAAIQKDISDAKMQLDNPENLKYKDYPFFTASPPEMTASPKAQKPCPTSDICGDNLSAGTQLKGDAIECKPQSQTDDSSVNKLPVKSFDENETTFKSIYDSGRLVCDENVCTWIEDDCFADTQKCYSGIMNNCSRIEGEMQPCMGGACCLSNPCNEPVNGHVSQDHINCNDTNNSSSANSICKL